jgi:murein DD-endopeptidase
MAWTDTFNNRPVPRLSNLLAIGSAALIAVALSGCSNALSWEDGGVATSRSVPAVSAGPASVSRPRHAAAETAVAMIGTPYRYGGATPNGFDCSGLVQYSYSSAGVKVPRTSRAQYGSATPINLTDAEPGDLLFFSYDRKISHVAIYLGDERFVHAPSSGKQVSVASLKDPHYQQHFVRVGRLPQSD